ncbi:MAG: hypothetical protein ACPIOQ_14120, partial [Promethearchaeia archaeon]
MPGHSLFGSVEPPPAPQSGGLALITLVLMVSSAGSGPTGAARAPCEGWGVQNQPPHRAGEGSDEQKRRRLNAPPGGSQQMALLGVLDARALVSYARLADLAPGAGGSAGAAGAALRRALGLDPSNAAAAASYARLLHREGNMAAAADWYRCSLSGDDPSPVSGDEPPEQSGLTTVGNASQACAQDKGHTRAQHPEAMAGYAALLLTHPALGHARSDDWRSAAPRRGDGGSFAEAEACRLLAQAAALAPASPAVVDGMTCLLTTALQRWSDANVAELMRGHGGGGLSRSEGRWAPLIEESLRQLELRV